MRKLLLAFLLLFWFAIAEAADQPKLSPLPVPLSNSAVTMARDGKDLKIVSFMGIAAKKTWDAVSNQTFELNLNTGKWEEMRPVPGVAGRLGASAAYVNDQVFVFGGYVLDGQGGQNTLPDLNVFVPIENRWYHGTDIPVPVDDSVIGIYRDRYIYLIGGWSKTDAVRNVQVYDTDKDKWMQATAIPGTPVFGHAGGIVGETIVYVDGAAKNPGADSPASKYAVSGDCWMGKIDKKDPTKVEWTKLPPHPGNARYHIAAGASEKESRIYFSGGSDNPFNYNGVGYNGQPAEPSSVTFAYHVRAGKWETINENTADPTMDNRGLLVIGHDLITVGGMEKGQQVTAKVRVVKAAPQK
jgi:N-acetylneuraminic acid mutarotase